jgi:hypothetical protein
MREALTDMWRSVALFVPKALAFVAILVIGYFVARALRSVTDRVLERVHFDRAVERGGIGAALARSKYDASDIVAKLVFYAVMLFTLQLAFGIWGPNPVSDLIGAVVAWLPRAFVAMIIIVVAAAIAAAVKDIIANALSGLSYGRLLANIASWFIIGLGVIAALNQIGVATTVTTPVLIAVLATIAGILIVGVGGGLVKPMQARWDAWLDRASQESQAIAAQARAYQAGRSDTERAMADVTPGTAPATAPGNAPATPDDTVPASGDPTLTDPRTGEVPAYSSGAATVYESQAHGGPTAAPAGTAYPDEPTQVIPPAKGPEPYQR